MRGRSQRGTRGHEPRPERGRVVVADDDVLLREGLARLLEHYGFEIIGQAGDGTGLLELVRAHVPDLAIVDMRMPPTRTTEGLEAAREIRERHPSVAVLVLSAYVEVNEAMELLCSGDHLGYLLKSHVLDMSDFIDMLDHILKGGLVIDPSMVQALLAAHRFGDSLIELTSWDCGVLALVAQGRTDGDIAEQLGTTKTAVEAEVRKIFTKLCVPMADAVHRRVLAVLAFLDAC